MRLVYVAGPFRGPTGWRIETNVRAAEALALRVWQAGAAAICPHTNSRFVQGEAKDSVFLEGTLEMLRRCDALILVNGWKHSEGSLGELDEAHELGLPVFFEGNFGALVEWIAEG